MLEYSVNGILESELIPGDKKLKCYSYLYQMFH